MNTAENTDGISVPPENPCSTRQATSTRNCRWRHTRRRRSTNRQIATTNSHRMESSASGSRSAEWRPPRRSDRRSGSSSSGPDRYQAPTGSSAARSQPPAHRDRHEHADAHRYEANPHRRRLALGISVVSDRCDMQLSAGGRCGPGRSRQAPCQADCKAQDINAVRLNPPITPGGFDTMWAYPRLQPFDQRLTTSSVDP
jgi:hypothetical protein